MNSIFGNIDDLYLFCSIVELGSLQRGAKHLRLPVSTVSRRLSQLEARLGVKLLEKQSRELVATSHGEELYQRISSEMRQTENQIESFLQKAGQVSGHLRLLLPYSMYRNQISSHVEAFLKQYPEVTIDIELTLGDVVPETDRDLVIAFNTTKRTDIIARPLFESHFKIYASFDYLARHDLPQTISDLEQHRWLTLTTSPVLTLYKDGEAKLVRPKTKMRVNDVEMLISAVVSGVGIAAIPVFHANAVSDQLTCLMPEYTHPSSQAYLLYRQRKHQPAPLSLLIETIMNIDFQQH
ncbi:transcriptional regulator [Veronia nyctiphanis]|uniref:Transcriptional regulator n=1 Tax=Veronia nyctiphanis TaxID=1278244 RepID=A0A4Q0YPN7_9GAMM|nr:LysR family transcriptional regulator [Veronia nyctiphanis]RXJ71149.1 transcriptional regulator [Veronia nyctiphanis]